MAKMFYSATEAAEKLGTTEDGVKDLVKEGKLREFRDAGSVNYKVDEVDKMAGATARAPSSGSSIALSPADSAGGSAAEIILEPAEGGDSSIELAGGSDILSLEDLDTSSGGTSAGTTAGQEKKKSDSVVASVGVNVFDDDIDEEVDPLAQTAVTDMAGLGLEGSGAGSGIMDLTRESDDTSLGQELLDEIYTDTDKPAESEDTKAGLEAAAEPDTVDADERLAVEESAASPAARTAVSALPAERDPVATGLTALMVVAVVVMWFAGLGGAALVRGVTPALLQWVYGQLLFVAAGALGLSILGAAIAYFVTKRSKS